MLQQPIFKAQVACPSCGTLSNIDYCTKEIVYTWWCDNKTCGKQFSFTVHKDWSVDAEPTGTVVESVIVVLEILPQKESIILEVSGHIINGEDNSKYYYEESTCPSNTFTDVLSISVGDNEDPHGLLRYIRTERG